MENLTPYIFPNGKSSAMASAIGASSVLSQGMMRSLHTGEGCLDDTFYVERCLFPRLLKRCVDSAQAAYDDDDNVAAYEPPEWFDKALARACRDGLPMFDQGRCLKLSRALDGLQAKYLNPYADRPLMLAMLIVVYALKDLLEQNVIVLRDGSDFADCVDVMLLILNDDNLDGLRDGVDKSARKNALRLLKAIQADGFFAKWQPSLSILGGGR